MTWTADRVQTLRLKWAEGLSASQIAKHLGGVTRNAVIGKVHRLGLALRRSPSRPATRRMRPAAYDLKPQRYQRPLFAVTPLKPLPAPPVAPLNIPLLERNPSQCRAVTDATRFEQGYCGHPRAPGSQYCAYHQALHYAPKPKRKHRRGEADELRRTERMGRWA